MVDITLMEKAIAHPTDSRLYHRSREQLAKHHTTLRSNLVLASRAMPGNLYDGHPLVKPLLHCFEVNGVVFKAACVDRGYRGCRSTGYMKVHIAGQ